MALKMAHGFWNFAFLALILSYAFCNIVPGEPEEGEGEGEGGGGGGGGVGVGGGGGGLGGVGGGGGVGVGEENPGISVPIHDPSQIVAKALLCFNDKYIYKSCEESYRLNAGGNLDVSTEQTEAYCGGPCLSETHLVLNCIDNVLTNFLFYNKATIQDVRDTIHAGCGYGPERGNFNVAQHIQAQEDASIRVAFGLVLGFMVIIGQCVLLFNFM